MPKKSKVHIYLLNFFTLFNFSDVFRISFVTNTSAYYHYLYRYPSFHLWANAFKCKGCPFDPHQFEKYRRGTL